jgi:hypothetical protein
LTAAVPSRLRRSLRRAFRVAAWVLAALVLAAVVLYLACTHRPRPDPAERPLFRGVLYTREVEADPRPTIAHVVAVDLDAPGIGILVTPGDPSLPRPLIGRTTSAFLAEFHVQVALNGDFFDPSWSRSPWDYYPRSGDPVSVDGLAISSGVVVSREARNPRPRTLYFSRDNRASFDAPLGEPHQAISGITLLESGDPRIADTTFARAPHPRSALALDRSRRRLLLIAVDGRQPGYSDGMTLPELVALIARHGGHDAALLDGGGSTTLVAEGASGEPEVLSSPIHTRIPGRERPVANHLGVFAAPL